MNARFPHPLAAIITVFLTAPVIAAQSQSPPSPSFEVASIKPAKPGASGSSNLFDMSGKFTTENSTLKSMIQLAYQIRAFQVLGGPPWLDRDAYDIVAKPEARPANSKQSLEMVQNLLADRFQLKFHRETRELPEYFLGVAKNGPKLHEAGQNPQRGTQGNPGKIVGMGVGTADLVIALGRRLGYTVIDKTGLTGVYDFTLTYDPNNEGQAMSAAGEPRPMGDDGPPSLFAAIQEQLGLKLETAKGPVEVIVIDRAEKPSEN